MPSAVLLLPAAGLVRGACLDAAYREVPNRIPLGMAAAWLAALALWPPGWSVAGASAAAAAVVLGAGFVFFAAGLMGGGDAKLMAATALWLTPAEAAAFVMATFLAGGVLALAALAAGRLPLPARGPLARLRALDAGAGRGLPYGVAVAAGGLFVLGGKAGILGL